MAAPESNADTIGRKMLAAGIDPKRKQRFPDSGQSAKPRFSELEYSEAAVADLTQPVE